MSQLATASPHRLYLATAIWLATAAVPLAQSSCASKKQGHKADLHVTAFAPTETTDDAQAAIQVQFDKPVVGESEIGTELASVPLTISPALPATAHWLDRQTLVMEPAEPMAPSTRYVVALTGSLAERTGGFEFFFVHKPLEIDGIFSVQLDALPTNPELPIQFNQDVRSADVADKCALRLAGSPLSMDLVLAGDNDEVTEQVTVKPASTLTQGTTYQLTCSGLMGAAGNTPLLETSSVEMSTYPTFSVSKEKPATSPVPPDEAELELVFSTPVDLEAVRAAITVSPEATGFTRGWLDASGKVYKAMANLEVTTDYTVTIDAGLTDSFGQKLTSETREWSFQTSNAEPRISMETGIYALEPSAGGYPIWSRNVDKFEVECASVPANKVAKVLTSEMDYDPWYDASDGDLDWKELGLASKARTIKIAGAKNKWHLDRLQLHELCGGRERGLFLANIDADQVDGTDDEVYDNRPYQRVLANVTDMGVLLKAGTASGLIWVASIATGEPVTGARVTVYSPQGKQVYSGTTNVNGIAFLPGTSKLLSQPGVDEADELEDEEDDWDDYEMDSYRSQRLIAVISKGDDMAVVDGNWANGIQLWNFGVSTDRSGGETRIRAFIQSDRGIYRPGETVYFKGLVREIAVGRPPVVPDGTPVKITVEDSRGASILDKRLQLSRFGGFHFDLPLEASAATGDYHVTALVKGQTFRESFSVEEFRPVAFEIDLKGARRHTRLGRKLKFELEANYLFGAPVAEANVEWNVQRRDHHLHFPQFSEYGFSDYAARGFDYWWYYDNEYDYLNFVEDGDGTTTKLGRFKFAVRDDDVKHDGPKDYVVRASVTDETDQSIGKQVVVTAHPSDFYVGLHTQEWVQAVDMPFAVNVVAVTPDGKQVPAKGKLSFVRDARECTWKDSGHRSYMSCTSRQDEVFTRDIDIPGTGTGTERIVPKEPGEYIIRVESSDSSGAKIVSSSTVWVIGKGEAFWSGDESARMSVIASKSEYQPGDEARLVAKVNMTKPTALVTLERNGVIDARVISMASSSEGITLPIEAAHAPNVFATVAMISGRTGEGDRHRPQFKMGVVDLKVSSKDRELSVAVETERDTYQPGEKVTGTITVTSGGAPTSAEVALSVADEGVLQLIAYKTPNPMKTFYASWGLGVDPATNWNRIARLNDPMEADYEEGADGDDGGGPEVRSRFVSSAFWAPALVTDDAGQARFEFVAPDNLTAFRLMAVAADNATKFGSGESRVTINKPLMAKPVLPRFLTEGDKARVGVVVHNHTGSAGTATVRAVVKGARLPKAEQTIDVASEGSARVVFTATALAQHEASFEFEVTMAAHRDALAVTIPVQRALTIEAVTVARGIVGDTDKTATVPVKWDDALDGRDSKLIVSADRLGMSELEPSLRYLIEYPYGCLEQTLSRFIPLVKVQDLAKSLDLEDLEGPKLKGFIRAGVAKVIRHQHADGHFSLWPSGGTYPHLTVYALWGLSEARRAGVKVHGDAIERGLAAMRTWAVDSERKLGPSGESGTVAMAAYLLAHLDKADAGLNARLYEARSGLPNYGKAFLLRALHLAKADAGQIDTLKGELIAAASGTGDGVIVKESVDLAHEWGSDTRSTAMVLSALMEIDPKNPLTHRLAEGLKVARRPSGYWHNTQDNLYALVALSDYARANAGGSSKVTLNLPGSKSISRNLTGGAALSVSRKLRAVEPGEIELTATGRTVYNVRLIQARADKFDTPVSSGLTITRTYLDPSTNQPVTEFSATQLVKVQLTIDTPEDRHYLAVVDNLPAGFEPVNARLATEAGATPPGTSDEGWYSRYKWTHIDLRDQGAQAFSDYLRAGKHTFEYLARATIAGSFVALPARAEAMYDPDVTARSIANSIEVKK